MASNLEAMASNLEKMASNLEAMATNLEAMASNLEAMNSDLEAMASKCLQPSCIDLFSLKESSQPIGESKCSKTVLEGFSCRCSRANCKTVWRAQIKRRRAAIAAVCITIGRPPSQEAGRRKIEQSTQPRARESPMKINNTHSNLLWTVHRTSFTPQRCLSGGQRWMPPRLLQPCFTMLHQHSLDALGPIRTGQLDLI